MPVVSRWFIRASLVNLALGFTLGALLLWNKGLPIDSTLARLVPAHIEFLVAGWVIQLVMGVATWIFPRFGVRRSPYGSETAAWVAFALLNAGVWLAGVGPIVGRGAGAAILPVAGRLAEVAAAVVFAANIWARVRASGLSEI
ncbi:MAG TPA: hypothetical protein VFU41_15615 [Gemmatimonadales bacterium]|nr:hypothetical protein [Gemmatimonadales bacterium]